MLRNRPVAAALGWMVAVGVCYQLLLAPMLPHSWLSYSTRPLWDKSEAPDRLISHFERPGEGRNGTELWCGLHGWKTRGKEVLVWDAVSCVLVLMSRRRAEIDRPTSRQPTRLGGPT